MFAVVANVSEELASVVKFATDSRIGPPTSYRVRVKMPEPFQTMVSVPDVTEAEPPK